MEMSVALIRQINEVDPVLRDVLFSILEEMERMTSERVTRDDFQELKQVVQELAQAQARTEARMDVLAQRMEELSQAQARTEARMDVLAQRMDELAQAQARTEIEVAKLAMGLQDMQKQVGGLSHAVGYGIEDRLMPFIPAYARQRYGLDVRSVERTFVETSPGNHDEVNILARGKDAQGEACLVAECKAQPGKKDVQRFEDMLDRIKTVLPGRIYPLLIGYSIDPNVQHYLKAHHPDIKTALTYQIERAGR